MTLTDKLKALAADPRAQKAGDMYKRAETGVWKAMEPLGRKVNGLAGRAGAEAFWPTELAEGELEKAARILRTFTLDGADTDKDPAAEAAVTESASTQAVQAEKQRQELQRDRIQHQSTPDKYADRKTQKVMTKIPARFLQKASGVAIMTCFRTGFGISGASGSGVVVSKLADGTWSAPSGILVHTLGWGFLIGLDIYDVVLILRTPEALKSFERAKVAIGGELSVAAGPVGSGAMLDSGIEASPCWSYTKSKGAYAGAQLDGTIILNRDDANRRFYGQQVSAADILGGRIKDPPAAVKPLWQTLYAAEGRTNVMGTEAIPEGDAPSGTTITHEEAEEFKAMDAGEKVTNEAHASLESYPQVPGSAPGTTTGAQAQPTTSTATTAQNPFTDAAVAKQP